VDAAREALKTQLDDPPPAVDFVSKQEGPKVLLSAINHALKAIGYEEHGMKGLVPRSIAKWWRPLTALSMLVGIVIAGILAIISQNPHWLWGVVAFGVVYAVVTLLPAER
jgi:hypothetical protein